MKTFREKAREIAANYESREAYEKLMDYVEKYPKVWADVLDDKVTLRMMCTTAIVREHSADKKKWRGENQSATFDRTTDEPHNTSVSVPLGSVAWTPEQEIAARANDNRAEQKNRTGIFEQVVYGYRVGDMTRKDVKEVENKFRTEATTSARQVSFFKFIRENLPDDKTKVREHFKENALKVQHAATDPYIIVRKRGKVEEKV